MNWQSYLFLAGKAHLLPNIYNFLNWKIYTYPWYEGIVVAVIVWYLDLIFPMQSVTFTTDAVGSTR